MLRLQVLCFLLFLPWTSFSQAGSLAVRIDGLTGGGAVHILLFNSAKGFPDAPQRAVKALSIPVSGTSVLARMGTLPFGTYAVSIYHDRNENGRLDRYPFGAPKEPYGFSNNARAVFSAPPFSKAAFALNISNEQINVRVR